MSENLNENQGAGNDDRDKKSIEMMAESIANKVIEKNKQDAPVKVKVKGDGSRFANYAKGLSSIGVLAVVAVIGSAYYGAMERYGIVGGEEPSVFDGIVALKVDKAIGAGDDMINSKAFNNMLEKAYQGGETKGIMLEMNSPGGSPVESEIIYERINHYKEKYPDTPVISVVKDLCASGCYYIASATDKIYASPTSIVGSIGVIMSGFGFTEAMEKVGVERRTYTAGENKAILDPFSDVSDKEKKHIETMLGSAHEVFIDRVKEGRGDALKYEEYDDIFSGLFWLGEDAKNRGLFDEYASPYGAAMQEFGTDNILFLEKKEPFNLRNLLLSTMASGDSIKQAVKSSIYEMSEVKLK